MENVETTGLSAARLATDAVIDEDMATVLAGGESRFPNGVYFIPADLATPTVMAEAVELAPMVIVIDENRNERWVRGRAPPVPEYATVVDTGPIVPPV
jgi:hypothetical protein